MSDEIVYRVPNSRTGKTPRIHTNRNCRHLKRSTGPIREQTRSDSPDDYPDCLECAGEVERHRHDEDSMAKYSMLADPDFGPEDLGLSASGGDR